MDVLVGPTFAIDVPSSPPSYAGDLPTGNVFFAGDSSASSSSIGTPDNSDDENDVLSPKRNRGEVDDDEEEVQSKLKSFNSLDSLEDSLPINRKGLSSHFMGKSKSFTDLSQVSTVRELQKQENPLNKRRRVLIAAKWRSSSFYTWSNPKSMPLLPMIEDDDDDEKAEDKEEATKVVSPSSSSSSSAEEKKRLPQQEQVLMMRQQNRVPRSYADHMRLRLGSFKSRSFSLADLQEHEIEEDEEEDGDNDEQHLG